ncbi:MAG: hypothetical protein CI949_2312 [Halanaerobium sp.]|jgi:hypothetical protein|nr:MAG: hypothetical protein CI949_2312 [Halanaerobium sp.]
MLREFKLLISLNWLGVFLMSNLDLRFEKRESDKNFSIIL